MTKVPTGANNPVINEFCGKSEPTIMKYKNQTPVIKNKNRQ